MSGIDSILNQLRTLEKGAMPKGHGFGSSLNDLMASDLLVSKKSLRPHMIGSMKNKRTSMKSSQLENLDERSLGGQASASSESAFNLSSDALKRMLQPKERPIKIPIQSINKPPFVLCPTAEQVKTVVRADHQISAIQNEFQNHQHFNEDRTKLLSGISTHENKTNNAIKTSVNFLPTKLLIKYGKQEYVQGRALEKWKELWNRRQRRLMQDGLWRWIFVVSLLQNTATTKAGATLVRIARGFLGRLWMKKQRVILDEANIRAARVAAIKGMSMSQCSLIIQNMVRRVAAKMRVMPLLMRHRGSLTIQRFFRQMHIMMQAKNNIRRRRQHDVLSRLIQKIMRGFLGRRRFKKAWKAARHQKIQKRLDSPNETFEYYFEQAGAATRIQQWWRRTPYICKMKWKRKYFDYYSQCKQNWIQDPSMSKRKISKKKIKKTRRIQNAAYTAMINRQMSKAQKREQIATLINPIVRGILGRARVLRIRSEISRVEALKWKCAIKIQSHFRRILVHIRLPLIGLRSRSLVHKKARWSQLKPARPVCAIHDKFKLLSLAQVPPKEMAGLYSYRIVPLHRDEYWTALNLKPKFGRRNAVSYSQIKILNSKTVDNMIAAVVVITRAFRRLKAKKIINALRGQKHLFASMRIQRWIKVCLMRRRCLRFRALVLPMFERCVLRSIAASRIQARWKVYLAMAWFTRIVRGRRVGIYRLQRFCRRISAKSSRKIRLHNKRSDLEVLKAGEEQYKQTEIFTHIDFIWQGAKKTRTVDVPHDMQKFFSLIGLAGMVDVSQVGRVIKAAGLIGKDLDIQTLESQFGKVKAPTDKRMGYSYWLEFLANIGAIKLLNIDASLLKGQSNGDYEQGLAKARGEVEVKCSEEIEAENKIKNYRFGRYFGRTALIMKVTYKYLIHLTDWKKAVIALGKKAAPVLAAKHVKECIKKTQQFVRNRLSVKRIDRGWRSLQVFKLKRRFDRYATVIQTLVRYFLGKRRIMRMAQSLYSKYIDDETEAIYWYNPRTANAFWIKPKLLGPLDCGIPIRMPHVDDQYIVICNSCAEKSATTFCDECNFSYCTSCFVVAHRGGKRKDHRGIHLDICVQCDFQLGTKECVQCQDLFCESCYKNAHSKGRLRLHISTWVTDPCEECGVRAAQWTQYGMRNNTGTFHWCIYCFRDSFNHEPRENSADSLFVKRYNFEGRSVRQFRGEREIEKTKRQVAADYAERLAALHVVKSERAATNIQRIWRSFVDKRRHVQFIIDRRNFFLLREQQLPLRGNLIYKVLQFWGLAPSLKSDTMMEKVKRQYPQHMHEILAECLSGQWKEACRLQREQEEHLRNIGNPSVLQAYLARLAVVNSARLLKSAEIALKRRSTILDLQKIKYRDARAVSKTPASILKGLLDAAEKTASEVDIALALKEARQEEVLKAEQKVVDFMGPRGLQKLVAERRRNGVLLPFTVTMIHGSTLALVHWTGHQKKDSAGMPEISATDPIGVSATAPLPAVSNDKSDTLLTLAMGSGYASQMTNGSAEVSNELPVDDSIESDIYKKLGYRPPPASDDPSSNRWTSTLQDFDVILIKGMHFQVLPPHFYDKEDIEDDDSDLLVKNDDDDDDDDDEEDEEEAKDHADDENVEDDMYPKIFLTPAHIVLDRPWVFDSVDGLEVYRAVPKIVYMRPLHSLGSAFVSSFVPQKSIAVAAITLHKLTLLNNYLSTMFDDESDTCQWLKENARQLEGQRDSVLRISRSMVQMSYDFSMRRRISKSLTKKLKSVYSLYQSVQRMLERAVGDPQAAALSWEVWEQSKTKLVVEIYIETLDGKKTLSEKLGEIEFDTKAPVLVMREYIQRAFRHRLNELQGDSFQFRKQLDDGSDFTLPRDSEIKTYSSDFCPFKMNNKTMEGSYQCVIVPEPLEEGFTGTFINEFVLQAKKKRGKHSAIEPE